MTIDTQKEFYHHHTKGGGVGKFWGMGGSTIIVSCKALHSGSTSMLPMSKVVDADFAYH
jgi:hypothetical protein